MDFQPTVDACPHCWDEDNIIRAAQSHSVHKDDCAYCCRTNQHEDGVYVCLACCGGFCSVHLEKHRSLHPSHALFVQLKQLPPSAAADEVKDVNYLGVGKPPEFESALCCVPCSVKFAQPLGLTETAYLTVVNSTSVGTQDGAAAYRGYSTREQCPHLVCLEQSTNPLTAAPPTSEEKCAVADCDCKGNNWLCVTCGAVGCPRVEAGGKGHAIFHNMMTGHPVVVKLGTVTADGADFYCYECDAEVSDVHFAAHMQHFGIDIRTAVKTAKTLGEIQYDYTAQFDFNLITEAGEDLLPVFGPGFTGMRNFGNTCYISSVLQCLFALKPFQAAFYATENREAHWKKCRDDPYSCHSCQVERIATGLLSGDFAVQGAEAWLNGITPREFKRVFAKNHPEFSTMEQQDAQEYFVYLLQELQRRAPVDPATGVRFHPSRCFEMVMEQRTECNICGKVRYSLETDTCLAVVPTGPDGAQPPAVESRTTPMADGDSPQRMRTTLDACLSSWMAPSMVECKCSECHQMTTYKTTTRLQSFPDVLTLYIRRACFDPATFSVKKKDVYVDVPESVSLERLRAAGPQAGEQLMRPAEKCSTASQPSAATVDVDEMALVTMISMGISEDVARYALCQTEMNVERAIDYVFSHPDIEVLVTQQAVAGGECAAGRQPPEGEAVPPVAAPTDGVPQYQLRAMISHMGASAKTGHYVCHVKDANTGRWVLFNDEKVAESKRPPLGMASIYFFVRN